MGRITVLGIGNILMSDEGLGVRALELLRDRYSFPDSVELLDGGTLGIDLIYHIEGTEKLLVLDAVLGGKPPGTLYRFENKEVRSYFRRKVSMHELGFQEVLGLLEVMEKPVERIVVLGIEPKSLEIGTELSEEVGSKMELLVEEAVSTLRNWGVDLLEKEREEV